MSMLIDLQKKIGAKQNGIFDQETLQAATAYYKLPKSAAAHFFGNCYHETGGFKLFEENLDYSAASLVKTWPVHFNSANASEYAHNPEKIANRAYASRMGNGNEASGDGYKYRGRGAIQITGKSAYEQFSKSINNPAIVTTPEIVADAFAMESAKWFFDSNKIWAYTSRVDDYSIAKVRKLVNGGNIGLSDVSTLTKKFFSWLS